MASRLLELQPELLDAIAATLSLRDLLALSATAKAAASLQLAVIGARIATFREAASGSHVQLRTLLSGLPECNARTSVAAVIERSMLTFSQVCSCNEEFVRLSRLASLRGVLRVPFASPIEAAALARSCCKTCDDVTRALDAVTSWLRDILEMVRNYEKRGERPLELLEPPPEVAQALTVAASAGGG